MFCKYCGNQLNDDMKFCPACGKEAAAPAPQYQAPAEPVYQAPAEPVYQAPVEPQYQAPAEPVYQAPVEPQYQAQYQAPAEPQYQAPQYQAPQAPQAAPAPAQSAGMFPLLSLIIGAVAATFGLLSGIGVFPLVMALLGMIPSAIFGVLGLIRSIKSKDKKGIIMSAIGLGLAFIAWIGAMTGIAML